MTQRAIIALGGNALIKKGQEGTIYEQFANTRSFSSHITKMIKEGWEIVLTHGNGPQVGSILLQNNCARELTPPMPLGICDAESQGLIGYMIQQCLKNKLLKEHIEKDVVSIITQSLVDNNDPALSNPTKPVGPYFSKEEAAQLKSQDGYDVIEQPRGWRIVVPSPDPKKIIEADTIKHLLDQGVIVIACGGGGCPVYEKPDWGLDGIEAVIDKDLASERLAEAVNADTLLILTNEEYVYLNYNTDSQTHLTDITYDELFTYYEQGQFPAGSMGPKVLAALRFIKHGGKQAIISHVDKAYEALHHQTGTHITK